MFGPTSTGLDAIVSRPRPSAWELFGRSPCAFLAQKLYTLRNLPLPSPPPAPVTVVCISDTHNNQCLLPNGDILIHAGDLTQSGSFKELQASLSWLNAQQHQTKIVIAGNHDLLLDEARDDNHEQATKERAQLDWGDLIYLQDSTTTIVYNHGRRLRIYGSPRSVKSGNWAFQYPRSKDAWHGVIPDNIDILVTHGPPYGHLDSNLTRLGCTSLLRELWRLRPVLHVFGHIHEGYGQDWLQFDALQHAYEKTLMTRSVWNLYQVSRAFLLSLISTPIPPTCQVVNPAMVGGHRDDERRNPIKVVV